MKTTIHSCRQLQFKKINKKIPYPGRLLPVFLVVIASLAISSTQVIGQNPIIQHIFTADPAAMVVGDTVFLYSGHDEASTSDNGYVMNDWHVFSSTDMVSWKDHGEVLKISTFNWAASNAWASHTVERNGKYYWYVTVSPDASVGGAFAIGVAVADHPAGPYSDALGTALITDNMTSDIAYDIDPAVFINNDGQAYLYWGNGTNCKAVRLKDNMVELDGDFIDITPPNFTEAAYMHEQNGVYYLTYAAQWPETIEYATASDPLGPFTYRGLLNDRVSSSTNHQSVIRFKGQWYFIYHTADLPGGGDYRRSVAVEYLYYNDDNTIAEIVQTPYGVEHTDSTATCPPVHVVPILRVNGEEAYSSRSLQVIEGDDISLMPETEGTGSWHWEKASDYGSIIHNEQELNISEIRAVDEDIYLAVFTNSCGTKSYTSYKITVHPGLPEEVVSGNRYLIESVATGEVISIENAGTANGSNVIPAPNQDLSSQQFIFTPQDDYYWQISPVNVPGRSLDVFNISVENGANIVIWDYWGGYGQLWQLQEVQAGIYNIVSRNSQKCLDVDISNDNVIQWECHGGTNQQFRLETPVSANNGMKEGLLRIFPNPGKDGRFSVRSGEGDLLNEIIICSSSGKVLNEVKNIDSPVYRSEFRLEPGLYIARIKTASQPVRTKTLVIGK